MGWELQSWLWLGFLGLSQILGGAEANAKITVRLYDYAGISETILTKAEREASRIYSHSGVQVLWMQCAESSQQATRFKGCEPDGDVPGIYLSILNEEMEGRMRTSAGLSKANAVPGFAVAGHAYVFLQRLLEICSNGRYPQDLILGVLMAHEVGHVLLGDNSHSPQGIMNAKLSPADLRLAQDRLLFFDARQATRIKVRSVSPSIAILSQPSQPK